MIKRLAGCVREYKLPAMLAPIFVLGEVILEVLIPFYMADLIDYGIDMGDMNFIKSCGLKLVLFALISLLCGIASGVSASVAGAGFGKNLTHDMYHHIQDFSFSNIDKFSTAGLVTRLTTDVTNVQMTFMMIIRGAVRSPAMLIFALVMAVRVNSQLALVFLGIVPILAVGIVLIFRTAFPYFQKVFKLYDRLNNVVQENLRGIRVVKAFVREEKEIDKFKAASKEMYETNLHAEYIVAFMGPLMQFSTYACTLLISWIGARLCISGSMSTGQLMTFISYVMQILMSLMFFTMIFMMSGIAGAAAKRIVEVLDEEPDIKNSENAVTAIKSGSVKFENVSFGYPDCKNCLEDISFEIRSGETIGILGGTGSGKTSLVQLIPRLYDVRGGAVYVDGTNVKDIDIHTLRSKVSMVLQKNVLFSGSIKDNLRWGKEDATDEEIIEACRLAQADGFISQMPGGYDYHIDQGGTNVSGGQRQRLCIARALIAKPAVLILDDSTSAVDTATDAKIRDAFKTYLPETTKIIIAQRVSSVQEADRIIVLDNGRINGIGTHEELLADNNIYREVYEAQTKDGDFDA